MMGYRTVVQVLLGDGVQNCVVQVHLEGEVQGWVTHA